MRSTAGLVSPLTQESIMALDGRRMRLIAHLEDVGLIDVSES